MRSAPSGRGPGSRRGHQDGQGQASGQLPAPQPAAQPSPHRPRSRVAVSQPMAEETEHVARYDAAIAPARDHALTDADGASLREAMAAAAGGRLADAQARRDKIARPRRPQAGRLVSLPWRIWHGIGDSRLSRCQPGLARARTARRSAPRRRCSTARPARRRSRPSSPTPSRRPPSASPRWQARYLADKDEAKAKALAQKAWIDLDIPASLEPAFLKRVGPLLTEADHKRRLDRLLFNDSRWTGERNERAAVIRRVIALLSEDEKKTAEARLAVFLRAKNSSQLLSKLPRAQPARLGPRRAEGAGPAPPEEGGGGLEDPAGRSGRSTSQASPTAGGRSGAPTPMRRSRLGKPKMAYELVRNPGPLSVNAAKDAVLPCGLAGAAPSARRQAGARPFRGAGQGRGRPAEPCARPVLARAARTRRSATRPRRRSTTQAASAYFDTFHGQLARLKVDAGARALKITPPAAPTPGGGRPLQRLRCRVGRRDRAQGRPRRQPRAGVPVSTCATT